MFSSYNPQPKPASFAPRRTVFDNAMVAHVWAQQDRPEGRSANGNFYFTGDTIYSYGGHFPIARFSRDKSIVWLTSRGYSVSTSGHVRYTRDALYGLQAAIIRVPDLGEFRESNINAAQREAIEEMLLRRAHDDPNPARAWDAFQRAAGTPRRKWPGHDGAVAALQKLENQRAAKAKREKLTDARKQIDAMMRFNWGYHTPQIRNEETENPLSTYRAHDMARTCERARSLLASARYTLARAKTGAKSDAKRVTLAGVDSKRLVRLRDVWLATVSAIENAQGESCDRLQIEQALTNLAQGKKCDYWYSPGVGVNATTETEILGGRIRRALQIGFSVEDIQPLMAIMQGRQFYRETNNATRESIRVVLSRKHGKDFVTPEQWLDGEGVNYYSADSTLLRRKGDKLETSRGAECPFAHAVIAFSKAQDCRATGTTWQRNGQQIRVGHFNVDSIDAQGNLKAGCHTIEYSEMLRLAIREVPHMVKPCFGLPAVSRL